MNVTQRIAIFEKNKRFQKRYGSQVALAAAMILAGYIASILLYQKPILSLLVLFITVAFRESVKAAIYYYIKQTARAQDVEFSAKDMFEEFMKRPFKRVILFIVKNSLILIGAATLLISDRSDASIVIGTFIIIIGLIFSTDNDFIFFAFEDYPQSKLKNHMRISRDTIKKNKFKMPYFTMSAGYFKRALTQILFVVFLQALMGVTLAKSASGAMLVPFLENLVPYIEYIRYAQIILVMSVFISIIPSYGKVLSMQPYFYHSVREV